MVVIAVFNLLSLICGVTLLLSFTVKTLRVAAKHCYSSMPCLNIVTIAIFIQVLLVSVCKFEIPNLHHTDILNNKCMQKIWKSNSSDFKALDYHIWDIMLEVYQKVDQNSATTEK